MRRSGFKNSVVDYTEPLKNIYYLGFSGKGTQAIHPPYAEKELCNVFSSSLFPLATESKMAT